MKSSTTKFLVVTFFLVFVSRSSVADQSVTYSYDANGNRVAEVVISPIFTGSIPIPGTGTYEIPLPAVPCHTGKLSAYINPIANGIWEASADVAGVEGVPYLRPTVANVIQYGYGGNQIVASLQPDGGVNSPNYFNNAPGKLAQVVVSAMGQGSTLYYSMVCFQ